MKFICWNIAGIRASLKRDDFNFLNKEDFDFVCIQETKATENEAEKVLPTWLKEMYPYRYWRSTDGISQRKGFSGTCIWSKTQPLCLLEPPELDNEGRVTTLEFDKFIIVNVYTPNSQNIVSDRCIFRIAIWDSIFREYIKKLNEQKPTIVCGDFNVANDEIDIWNACDKIDGTSCIGFLDEERLNFKEHLQLGYVDAFRYLNKEANNYTYWDQRMPWLRKQNKGWRIDYYLVPNNLKELIIKSDIRKEITGSDHCPITLQLNMMT
jgi:exodeoxyribonuclease III|tara:strand:- start:2156 stop:2953 length:798 start_codon:yes stop_codon:yes gene_type:complete